MQKLFSYTKNERLKSRKLVDEVFTTGKSISVTPIRVFYITKAKALNAEPIVKAGITVSSKNFKKAVDRNRIKRLLRETYRRNKQLLINVSEQKKIDFSLFFLFTGKALPTYETTEKSMKIIIKKLYDELADQNT